MAHLDKRGRRIGRNWWREYIVDLWFCADQAWWRECEQVAVGYETETQEFTLTHPRPTLKIFMMGMAGSTNYTP
jgi:hypothetical protein